MLYLPPSQVSPKLPPPRPDNHKKYGGPSRNSNRSQCAPTPITRHISRNTSPDTPHTTPPCISSCLNTLHADNRRPLK